MNNWTYKVTTAPTLLPVSLKDMLASANVTPSVSTTLSSPASLDDTNITVGSTTGFAVGQTIAIGDEHAVITSISGGGNAIHVTALPAAVASGSPVTYSDENLNLINALQAAVSQVEAYLNRALITQTITFQADCFPSHSGGLALLTQGAYSRTNFFTLPKPPLQSVTSLKYYQTDNTLATFASSNYFLDTLSEPSRLFLNENATWPTEVRRNAAIEIIYIAGYGALRSSVPSAIREAITMQAVNLYTIGSTKGLNISSIDFGTASLKLKESTEMLSLSVNAKNMLDASGLKVHSV